MTYTKKHDQKFDRIRQTPPALALARNFGRADDFRLHCSRGGKLRAVTTKGNEAGKPHEVSAIPKLGMLTTKVLVSAPESAMDQSLKVVQFYTGCLEFFLSRHAGRNCHRQRARRPKSCAVDRRRRSIGTNRAQFAVCKPRTSTTNSVFCAVGLGFSDVRPRIARVWPDAAYCHRRAAD